MTNVSVTATDINDNSYTFTFQDGDVHSVKSVINANPETNEIATSPPGQVQLFDFNGPSKSITCRGALTAASSTRISGYSITTILQQKQWLESVINGNQVPITFASNYESETANDYSSPTPPYIASFSTTKVLFGTIDFEEVVGNPNSLAFTMSLVCGDDI